MKAKIWHPLILAVWVSACSETGPDETTAEATPEPVDVSAASSEDPTSSAEVLSGYQWLSDNDTVPEILHVLHQGKTLQLRPSFLSFPEVEEADFMDGKAVPGINRALAKRMNQVLEIALGNPFEVELTGRVDSEGVAEGRITTARGLDFGEKLISEGVAVVRVPGDEANLSEEELAYLHRLRGLQREATFKGRGRWVRGIAAEAFVREQVPEKRHLPTENVLAATNAEGILGQLNRRTTIRGTVSRIGATSSGHITFINFRDVPREGFVAIVRENELPRFHQEIEGFPESLIGKTVELTGVVSQFRDTPQMELQVPEQIRKSEP